MDLVVASLIKRAKRGEVSAFAELVDTYKDKIYAFLYRMTGNREDADDLAQEVFIRVYSNLHTFDQDMRFSPWLYRIAQNLAIDFLRKRKKTVYLDDQMGQDNDMSWQLESQAPGPEDVTQFHDFQTALETALRELAPMYRMVLLLRFAHDMSYEDIAKVTELPITTVKTRLHRARESLRQALAKQGY
ncbi:MAG: ECF RNA polymerase sigma factor SigW [Firmicutes bacterium]|nr:ECF RNA polymerase sigma factor SigW [candidate division NPL-UPA2 bacterium]MBT9153566.1 ECF RNA polymerase sigma factor SigW [candidate division NPL-UPA2 bacterium]MBT9155621.1 ECF RNA polymerase sigma factor SigW [candidate division NPL-UPA2 bacterium]